MSVIDTISYILKHPLNRQRKLAALSRFASWQLSSRLAPGPIAVPFVNSSRLLVSPSMTGATGNIYCGLHEYEDMAFLLHVVRPDDLFVDIGANIGSYTILASAAVGCTSIAIEPVPATCARLRDNIKLNGVEDRVSALNVGCGAASGQLEFTSGLDTVNHVATSADDPDARIRVPVERLDTLLAGRHPALIKIDVEGYETQVLAGGPASFGDPSLFAVIMELNGSGARYGADEQKIHADMLANGFVPVVYRPRERRLVGSNGSSSTTGNTLYVRGKAQVEERLRSAPAFSVLGRLI